MGVIIAGYYTIKAAFSEGAIGLEAEQVLAFVAVIQLSVSNTLNLDRGKKT